MSKILTKEEFEKNIQLVTQREAVLKSYERLKHNRVKDWGLHGHDLGIHPLNMLIGGAIPGKLTAIGGRSGHGKTALTTEIFKGGSKIINGRRCEFLCFSWEMDASYMVDRHVCNTVGLTVKMLQQGAKLLGEQAYNKIKQSYKEAASFPISYQQHSIDISTVKALCIDFVKKVREKEQVEGIEIVPTIVIDYIGMASFEGAGLRTYAIAEFMNGFKQLINELAMCGIVFAQIGRGADNKDMPDRTDFADSQTIENASDNLLLIHRPEYNNIPTIKDPETGEEVKSNGKILIRALKSRDYGVGDLLVNCDIKHYRFWDLAHEYGYDYTSLYSKEEFWLDYFGLKRE